MKLPPLALQELDRFLERLESALHTETVVAELEGDKLKLYLYGSRLAAERTVLNVRKLIKEYSTPRRGRSRAFSLRLLAREAKTAIPGDVLVEALKLLGYDARLEGDSIETNAPEDAVYGLAAAIGGSFWDMRLLDATRTAKKLLAGIMALIPRLSLGDAVREAEELGVLVEDEEYKLRVAGDWREALKILYSKLGMRG